LIGLNVTRLKLSRDLLDQYLLQTQKKVRRLERQIHKMTDQIDENSMLFTLIHVLRPITRNAHWILTSLLGAADAHQTLFGGTQPLPPLTIETPATRNVVESSTTPTAAMAVATRTVGNHQNAAITTTIATTPLAGSGNSTPTGAAAPMTTTSRALGGMAGSPTATLGLPKRTLPSTPSSVAAAAAAAASTPTHQAAEAKGAFFTLNINHLHWYLSHLLFFLSLW
jgi:cytoskeletal protein RodZ